VPGNSGNGSRHIATRLNLYNNATPGRLTDYRRESKRRRSKDVSDCIEHNVHQHQLFIRPSNATPALSPATLGARCRRIFHATNEFATRTHVERKKETTNVLLQRRNYHKSTNREARSRTRPSTCRTIRAVRLNARRLPTNEGAGSGI